jgi:UDP-2,3-diacylglucosamine hydrolase
MNRPRPELQAAPPSALVALPLWQAVDFISDLHLHASEPLTFAAWQRYMATTSADAVFILGDLFEVWVGDDAAGGTAHREGATPEDAALDADAGFEAQCAAILRQTASRIPVFFMRGNRDFLVGPALMAQCGCTLLDDPTVLDFGGVRWLLSHGDALCLADTEYLKFRAMVRGDDWQQNFLAKPLAERRAIARALRSQSEARKQSGVTWIDVDTGAAINALRNAGASHMIHGHTHQPADHALQPGLQRSVLSDWDLAAATPRAEVLRVCLAANHPAVTGPGASIRRIAPDHAWAK